MRPHHIRLLVLASEATPRQWVIGTVIAVALIGAASLALAIYSGAQSWDRSARAAAEVLCERSLRDARNGPADRSEPVCQCTAAQVAAQRPSLAGYLSQHTARREARSMAELALPACQQEAAS